MIGETVGGRYRLERLLGRGGMGSVYEARSLSGGDPVALKLITQAPDHPEVLQRVKVEAKAAGMIDSPHVARMLETDIDAVSYTHLTLPTILLV